LIIKGHAVDRLCSCTQTYTSREGNVLASLLERPTTAELSLSLSGSVAVQYSPEFNAFIARCLQKEPDARPTAIELLTDPFLAEKDHKMEMLQLIAEIKIMNLQDGGGGEEVDERVCVVPLT
jgi:serine/threonine protein kinase